MSFTETSSVYVDGQRDRGRGVPQLVADGLERLALPQQQGRLRT